MVHYALQSPSEGSGSGRFVQLSAFGLSAPEGLTWFRELRENLVSFPRDERLGVLAEMKCPLIVGAPRQAITLGWFRADGYTALPAYLGLPWTMPFCETAAAAAFRGLPGFRPGRSVYTVAVRLNLTVPTPGGERAWLTGPATRFRFACTVLRWFQRGDEPEYEKPLPDRTPDFNRPRAPPRSRFDQWRGRRFPL